MRRSIKKFIKKLSRKKRRRQVQDQDHAVIPQTSQPDNPQDDDISRVAPRSIRFEIETGQDIDPPSLQVDINRDNLNPFESTPSSHEIENAQDNPNTSENTPPSLQVEINQDNLDDAFASTLGTPIVIEATTTQTRPNDAAPQSPSDTAPWLTRESDWPLSHTNPGSPNIDQSRFREWLRGPEGRLPRQERPSTRPARPRCIIPGHPEYQRDARLQPTELETIGSAGSAESDASEAFTSSGFTASTEVIVPTEPGPPEVIDIEPVESTVSSDSSGSNWMVEPVEPRVTFETSELSLPETGLLEMTETEASERTESSKSTRSGHVESLERVTCRALAGLQVEVCETSSESCCTSLAQSPRSILRS